MAKTNKYKSKGGAKAAGGVGNSVGTTRTVRPAKASTGDGECHVNVPVPESKPLAAVQQEVLQTPVQQEVLQAPVQQEVLQTPVLSVPPLESTIEAWADPIADNSSYASAESEEPSPGASTPPAATLPASTQQTITEPAAAAPAVVSVPVEAPAVLAPAVLAPAAAAEPAAPLGYDLADEAALAPKPAGAAPAAALVLSWAELLLRAYTFPVSTLCGGLGSCHQDVQLTHVQWVMLSPCQPVWADMFVHACVSLQAYLTAGATVGLVRGVMDQLPLRH